MVVEKDLFVVERKLLDDLKGVRGRDFFKDNEKVVVRSKRVLDDYKFWAEKVEVFLLTLIRSGSVGGGVVKGDKFVVAWGNTYYEGSPEYDLIMRGDF